MAHRAASVLRILGEIAGAAFVCVCGFYAFVFFLVTGLWVLVGLAGYLAFPLAVLAVGALDRTLVQRARLIVDTLLLALVPAALLTMGAVIGEWPFGTRGFDAHGYGASGGAVNVALFGGLHVALWLALMLGVALRRRGRAVASATPVR